MIKVIIIEWCYKVILPDDVVLTDGSYVEWEEAWCPYLFRHYPTSIHGPIDSKLYDGKYMYCKLINAKFKVYRGYGDMKKMFAECPLDDIPDTDKLIAQLEAQLEEMSKQHC